MSKTNPRILLIVESPNKISLLKSFLPSNYIVMASFGHISQIKDGGSYWNTGINPNDNFKADFALSPDKDNLARVNALKEQVRVADKVILCSDPDREGEAIAWSLKKFLKIPESKYERCTFHEITKSAVLKALENSRKIDNDLVSASHARMKLDKILGYRLSPIAKRNVQARSVGRCQSAGLKLITDRENEIINFIPKKYFELWLHFVKNNTEFKAKYIGTNNKKEDKIEDIKRVQEIIDACNPPFVISKVDSTHKNEYPKPPFTTSTYLQEVTNKLGLSVDLATSYAQRLFEGINVGGQHLALITYIRTDSSDIAEEFKPQLESFVKETFGKNYYAPLREVKKGENVQDGHECIRCIDLSMTPDKLDGLISDKNIVKVYDIIYRRTVASMMKPRVVRETTYTIYCSGYLFEFVSREQEFDGYRRVYKYDEDEKGDVVKEIFELDEKLKVKDLESVEKETKPKSRFKEATFIKELESTGIGRPSTYQSIVKTLLDASRGYCTLEDNYLVPTEKGIELSNFLEDKFHNLININYTSEMEKGLDDIANGKINELDFLESFYKNLEKTVHTVIKDTSAEPSNEVCPLCGAPMVLRSGQYGKFYGCSKFPKCKGVKKINV